MKQEDLHLLIKVANVLRHVSDVMFKASIEAKVEKENKSPTTEEKVVRRGRGRPRKVQ
jgi:hypothetical protein